MTPTRWLIVLFWVVVIALLLHECMQEDAARVQQGNAEKKRQYFFVPPISQANPTPPPAPPIMAADVRQVSFITKVNTPGAGSFTCYVTVRNQGLLKATSIRVHVRPYRGAGVGSIDIGPAKFHILKETDPLSQYGTWLSFPDLKPGESATQSAVFFDHPNIKAGFNPNPEIIFETAK
jgi:hypothetical protein